MCSLTSAPLTIIKFAIVFIVFPSLKISLSQMGQEPGQLCFQPLAPGGLTARIPGFHPSYSGPIPGQGTEILLEDYFLLSL